MTSPGIMTGNRVFRTRAMGVATLLAAAMLIAACGSTATSTSGSGTLAVQLTDAPFSTDSVLRVDVFVVRVDGRMADADSATAARGAPDDSAGTGGWTTLAAPGQTINLLAYQGGLTLPLGQASVPATSYLGFRLVIDPTRSSVTLKNGTVLSGTSIPDISFPSAARSGIKIVLTAAISVVANETTTMLVDFMVGNSFVMRGTSIAQNGLLFTPVVRASTR